MEQIVYNPIKYIKIMKNLGPKKVFRKLTKFFEILKYNKANKNTAEMIYEIILNFKWFL